MTESFSLEKELKKKRRTATAYVDAYGALKIVFDQQIHPMITAAATARDGIFLTDHGPEHIARVIDRAGQLVRQSSIKLSTYEIFILLVAIHLHDVGNALGRKDHELNADKIWQLAYGPLGFDQLNKFMAMRIAEVHGGARKGDRDTIRNIEEKTTWKSEEIRPQYLAAILRLADELAEDRHRANAINVQLNQVERSSEAHHVFAYGLHSFESDAQSFTIDIKAAYPRSFFLRRLGKADGDVALLDEIYSRTMKTYQEAIYCSRYLRGGLRFDRVRATVDILDDNYRTEIKKLRYVIEEHGYRQRDQSEIFRLAPELADFDGNGPLTSERLTEILEGAHAPIP